MTSASAGIDTRRICETPDCGTVLSKHNSRPVCASCEARLEVGGASIPLPRQPAFPSRPPAPTRPTTEGGVMPRGPVAGKPAPTLEEAARMASASRTATVTPTPGPTCAECGEPLPKHHEGWLCRLCKVASAPPPAEAPIAPKHRVPPPAPILYDQVKAARIYRESGGNLSEVARELGCSWDTARSAVARELSPEEFAALKRKQGRPTRHTFDRAAAAETLRETRSIRETARRFGIRHETMRRALATHLGAEYADLVSRPAPATPASGSAPSIEDEKPEAPAADPTPVAPAAADPTPTPVPLDLRRGELETRVEQIKLLLDHNTLERGHLNDQARQLLEEWGDINWRLSKLSDEAA